MKPATLMVLVALAFSAPAQCQEPGERFDRLSNSLADLSDEYANDTMKTISFLLLVGPNRTTPFVTRRADGITDFY